MTTEPKLNHDALANASCDEVLTVDLTIADAIQQPANGHPLTKKIHRLKQSVAS